MSELTSQPKLSPVEDFVFSGLKTRFNEVFQIPSVFTNSTDEIQVLKRLQEKGVSYPYVFFSVTSMSITKDSYRPQSLFRRGICTMPSTDDLMALRVKLLPTDFTIECRCKDNSFDRLLKYGKLWLFSSISGFLKFTINYGNQPLDVSILLDDTITFSKREAGPDQVAEHEVITSLTLRGYSSPDSLQRQPIARQAIAETEVLEPTDANVANVQFIGFPA